MPDDMRATLVALIVPIIHRPCPMCGRPEPARTGDQVDCSTCLDSGSAGPIFDKADAEKYAQRIAAAIWAEVGPEVKRLRRELGRERDRRRQARTDATASRQHAERAKAKVQRLTEERDAARLVSEGRTMEQYDQEAAIERARAFCEKAKQDCARYRAETGTYIADAIDPDEVLAALAPLTPDDRAEVAARIHTLDQPAKFSQCGQCGRPFSERACGPTHALVAHERGGDLTRHLPGYAAPAPRRLTEQQGGIPNDAITPDDQNRRHDQTRCACNPNQLPADFDPDPGCPIHGDPTDTP